MKITTKIWLGLVSLIVLMAGIVGYNYYQLQSLRANILELEQKRVPIVLAAKDLSTGFARQAAGIRGYLATGNQKFIDECNTFRKLTDEKIAFLEKEEMDKEILAPVIQSAKSFEPHPPKMIELYQTQGQQSAVTYMATIASPDNAKVIAETSKYADYEVNLIQEAVLKVRNIENQIERITVILLAIGVLLGAIVGYVLVRSINTGISRLIETSKVLASGDLSVSINSTSHDELGELARALSEVVHNTRNVLNKVQQAAFQLSTTSEELAASAEQTTKATEQVTGNVQQVASGVTDQVKGVNSAKEVIAHMSKGLQMVAKNASDVKIASSNAYKSATQGNESIKRAVEQMDSISTAVDISAQTIAELGEKSKSIGQIVEVISGIASQTNLLALNAAIEAARAGEMGKGFAVVAEEVRKLAEGSSEAAQKIEILISEIQLGTEKTVSAMRIGTKEVATGKQVVRESGTAFQSIANLINEVARQIQDVSVAVEELSFSSKEIVTTIEQIQSTSEKSAAETQSIAASSEEQNAAMQEIASSTQVLSKLAEDLQNQISIFKI
ncbi:MCP four helix bundle domain-containing protein [Heliobacterium chlorum]|uniref:MCP four helix bundle domain-containing protein n=1 Tax=Heliobacterium chlorum TaxID=2698 RepID=A0ABR7T0W2_HELCL|nr:methyl-accepting chemotaxis protein [Heliobacterium chlorum]MBC9784423.1 MCP four helix bundle domain-containing protein [Heliobacterium chlorum]